MQKIYIVTARRWGSDNTHNYVVGAFFDQRKAMITADIHCAYRGGTYSCIVEEFEEGRYDEDARCAKEVYRAKGYE